MIYKPFTFNDLRYFSEWGGRYWENLIKKAFNFLDRDLRGKVVLDIGTRYGKMACLFGLLGAKVIGIDIDRFALIQAALEINKHNLNNNILLLNYDGDLDVIKDGSIDIVFTKSVLVVVNDLDKFLIKINNKLKIGGKIVFIENAKGNQLIKLFRIFRHRKWNYSKVNYFTQKEILMIKDIFELTIIKKTLCYPIYLICGVKK